MCAAEKAQFGFFSNQDQQEHEYNRATQKYLNFYGWLISIN